MKYCSKCGKEIHEEAIICVHCGCSVEGTRVKSNKCFPNTLENFLIKVKTVYILSILGLALSLGIGVVFCIISEVKRSRIKIPASVDLNRDEYEELEKAKKQLNIAKMLNVVTTAIFAALMAIIGCCLGLLLVA